MSLENAPAFMGLRVPHVARWTGEVDITPSVVDGGDRLRYTAPIVDAACRWKGVLWQRWVQAQGKGEPIFDSLHSTRQHVAIWEQRCQVCNEPTRAESRLKGGTLYLIGSNREAGSSGPIMEGELTENAPLNSVRSTWDSSEAAPCLLRAGQGRSRLYTGMHRTMFVRNIAPVGLDGFPTWVFPSHRRLLGRPSRNARGLMLTGCRLT